MPLRDFMSQLQVPDVDDRFRGSAGQRELVKEQIKLGKSPAEIERRSRVERRAVDMGIGREEAAEFARDVKAAVDTRESRATRHPANPGLERIIGENDLISSVFLERGSEATRPVCCIQENTRRIGTGFLVTPRVLLTNAHVIADQDGARSCLAEFNFEDKLIGMGTEESITFRLRPDELFFSSPENDLDYTLVAVEPTSGSKALKDYGFLPLETSVANALRGECLNILQHPNGAPKRLALRQNRFTALLEKFVHYESDTLPGSSGSPVFNDQWQVICLHHAGVPLKDSQGNILTVDNRVWNQDTDPPSLIKWIGNEGIRISRIVADVIRQVRDDHGDLWPRLLAEFPRTISNPPHSTEHLGNKPNEVPDEIDEEQRRQTDKTPRVDDAKTNGDDPKKRRDGKGVGARIGNDRGTPVGTARRTQATSVTITVQVGDAEPVVVSLDRGNTSGDGKSAEPDDEPDEDSSSAPAGMDSASLVKRGLRNLERSQTRKYYEKTQDEADSAAYYRDIDADADSLPDDLQARITETHTTKLSYKVARIEHLYAWVDLQRDKKVRSIYSDERFNPERFIENDFTIERGVERLVARRMERESFSPESLERLTAALEAQESFNCEHVVPQSWFGADAPMQGDLHHLFTCQMQCNSFRGNLPYKDFGKFSIVLEAATRPKCGFSDDGLFEPFMGKGKVARATLYFLLRYRDQFENMYEGLADGLETLLEWHKKSPVTEHELHRNQAIFGIQGNRNPFIDRPKWAKKVFDA